MLGSEAADEWRMQRRIFLKDFFISRAAFEKLERAKHWTAIHVRNTILKQRLKSRGGWDMGYTCDIRSQKPVNI